MIAYHSTRNKIRNKSILTEWTVCCSSSPFRLYNTHQHSLRLPHNLLLLQNQFFTHYHDQLVSCTLNQQNVLYNLVQRNLDSYHTDRRYILYNNILYIQVYYNIQGQDMLQLLHNQGLLLEGENIIFILAISATSIS